MNKKKKCNCQRGGGPLNYTVTPSDFCTRKRWAPEPGRPHRGAHLPHLKPGEYQKVRSTLGPVLGPRALASQNAAASLPLRRPQRVCSSVTLRRGALSKEAACSPSARRPAGTTGYMADGRCALSGSGFVFISAPFRTVTVPLSPQDDILPGVARGTSKSTELRCFFLLS